MIKGNKNIFSKARVLSGFVLLFTYSLSNAQVYSYQTTPIKKKPEAPPALIYRFNELSDIKAYSTAKEEIASYKKFKKLPFTYPEVIFVNPSLAFKEIDTLIQHDYQLQSMWYYVDTIVISKNENTSVVGSRLPYKYIYKPFAILDHEVSNAEYTEFITYVRDSIARSLLATSGLPVARYFGDYKDPKERTGFYLKWNKKIPYETNDDSISNVLNRLYFDVHERFYNRKETDYRKLNFQYSCSQDSLRTSKAINIVPDTLVWVHGFNLKGPNWMEPLSNMYRWHPAYADNPVVGLSHQQVNAFLAWKTQKLQQELDRKKILYTVELSLPTEIDLEMMAMLKKVREQKVEYANNKFYNFNFVLSPADHNLFLDDSTKTLTVPEQKFSHDEWYRNQIVKNSWLKYNSHDMAFYTTISYKNYYGNNVHAETHYKTLSSFGTLPFLNGNVSEMMQETFSPNQSQQYSTSTLFPIQGNYNNAFTAYLKAIGKYTPSAIDSLKNSLLNDSDSEYHLVRGANWFDSGDWLSGSEKRNFVSSKVAYSTLGFRYVIRFEEKSK